MSCYIKAFQCLDSFLCFCVTLRTIDTWYQQAESWSCKDLHFILTRCKKKSIPARNLPWFCATSVSEKSKCDRGDSVLTALEVRAINMSFIVFRLCIESRNFQLVGIFEKAPCSLTRCGSHPQTHVLTSSLNTAASWFPHAVLHYSLMSSSTRVISSFFFSHLSWKDQMQRCIEIRTQRFNLFPCIIEAAFRAKEGGKERERVPGHSAAGSVIGWSCNNLMVLINRAGDWGRRQCTQTFKSITSSVLSQQWHKSHNHTCMLPPISHKDKHDLEFYLFLKIIIMFF